MVSTDTMLTRLLHTVVFVKIKVITQRLLLRCPWITSVAQLNLLFLLFIAQCLDTTILLRFRTDSCYFGQICEFLGFMELELKNHKVVNSFDMAHILHCLQLLSLYLNFAKPSFFYWQLFSEVLFSCSTPLSFSSLIFWAIDGFLMCFFLISRPKQYILFE